MQNRNEFIQVSKVLLNNLIHSSSFGRNCGLWLMYWVRQKMHSWSHLHLIYNCQKTAHQPFPREQQSEVDFIWGNVTTEMVNEYSKQRPSQARMLAAENVNEDFGAPKFSHNSRHFQMCQKETFQMWYGEKRESNNNKKKPNRNENTGPCRYHEKINQLMK